MRSLLALMIARTNGHLGRWKVPVSLMWETLIWRGIPSWWRRAVWHTRVTLSRGKALRTKSLIRGRRSIRVVVGRIGRMLREAWRLLLTVLLLLLVLDSLLVWLFLRRREWSLWLLLWLLCRLGNRGTASTLSYRLVSQSQTRKKSPQSNFREDDASIRRKATEDIHMVLRSRWYNNMIYIRNVSSSCLSILMDKRPASQRCMRRPTPSMAGSSGTCGGLGGLFSFGCSWIFKSLTSLPRKTMYS